MLLHTNYREGELRVRDVMTRAVIAVPPSFKVIDAIAVMKDKRIKSLPVVEGDRCVGIVTTTDILREVTSSKGVKEDLTVDKIMSKDLIYVSPSDDLDKAAELMFKNDIRHLIVLDGDRLVGILADIDLLKCIGG